MQPSRKLADNFPLVFLLSDYMQVDEMLLTSPSAFSFSNLIFWSDPVADGRWGRGSLGDLGGIGEVELGDVNPHIELVLVLKWIAHRVDGV